MRLPSTSVARAFATRFAVVATLAAPPVFSQAAPRPQPTCITNVTLQDASAEGGERLVNILLRSGRIEAVVDAGAPVPPGMRVVEGEGLLCLPGFIDAFTETGIETPEPVADRDIPVDTGADIRIDMRLANRKGIQPAFRAAEALAIGKEASEAWREAGFGTAHVAPAGELLSGSTCVAATREAAARDLIVAPDAFASAGFDASGRGYPSTLMGYIAQLRQFFLDAERHVEMTKRYAAGRPGPRPPFDAELSAGAAVLDGGKHLMCAAETHRDVERWVKLADAFGFEFAVAGGREVWRVADTLAANGIDVVLTLDWGKEVKDPSAKKEEKKEGKKGAKPEEGADDPEAAAADEPPSATETVATNDEASADAEQEGQDAEADPAEGDDAESEIAWEYDEPFAVRMEKRREWEEIRDGAIRLHEAGVRFAFGTADGKPDKLIEKVRQLVEAGLPREVALSALTDRAAAMLGVEDRLGAVRPGKDATLTLWSADPLVEKKAKPVWVFVDGFSTEYDEPEEKDDDAKEGDGPAEGVDATGAWTLTIEGDGDSSGATLVLEMSDSGAVTGTQEAEGPGGSGSVASDVTGSVSGATLRLSGSFSVGDVTVSFEYELELDGDELSGDATYTAPGLPEPMVRSISGTRTPEQHYHSSCRLDCCNG